MRVYSEGMQGNPAYPVSEYPLMYNFHILVDPQTGTILALMSPTWMKFQAEILNCLPPPARYFNLYNSSFCFLALIARFTFSVGADGLGMEYGKMDDTIYNIERYENVQAWLLDPVACPTKNPVVLDLRKKHKNWRRTSAGGAEPGSSASHADMSQTAPFSPAPQTPP